MMNTRFKKAALALALATVISLPLDHALAADAAAATAPAVPAATPGLTIQTAKPSDYITQYPGLYLARNGKEKATYDAWFADNKAIRERGEIDVKAMIAGKLPANTPGYAGSFTITEEWARYHNSRYIPDDKLYHDKAYAQSMGYKDILVFPTVTSSDDIIMNAFPAGARDTARTIDLNHSIANYKPIYPGDTLYVVINSRDAMDTTPESGSMYRFTPYEARASIYNQRGEKVQDSVFRSSRVVRNMKDGLAKENPGFFEWWDAPDWKKRKAHNYTDADWKTIENIWQNEKHRGAEPLYWEDVKVGDRPTWTADGPVQKSVLPVKPWGDGLGGIPSLRSDYMDLTKRAQMVKDKYGIYTYTDVKKKIKPIPSKQVWEADAGTQQMLAGAFNVADIHVAKEGEDDRDVLINYIGREFAIRHLNSWMGDRGWLQSIRWSIMDPRAHRDADGLLAPDSPFSERFIKYVPGMESKYVNIHGLAGDLGIVKSYVRNKFVKNGEFFVDVIWWIENIDGDIWEEGGATIKLPSKKASQK